MALLHRGVSLLRPACILVALAPYPSISPSLNFSSADLQGSTQRYFACSKGGSGSFLKPGKFSVGTSMAEALRQQYVDMNAPLLAPENLLPDAYASTSKGGKKVHVEGRGKGTTAAAVYPDHQRESSRLQWQTLDVLLSKAMVVFRGLLPSSSVIIIRNDFLGCLKI